jgi:hypothetical protein
MHGYGVLMRIKPLFLLIIGTLLFTGCALKPVADKNNSPNQPKSNTSTGNSTTPSTSASKQDHVYELLSFLDSYSNMTLDAQKKAFSAVSQALSENKTDTALRIKLAGMYAIPSSRLRDLNKAQSQLQDLLQENTLAPGDYNLVSLLYEYSVFDNKQLQKEREEIKKLEATTQRLDSTQQKLDALQQRYDALEQKLNDLKNIEKTLNERGTKSK